jgi:hypothetical protein
LVTLGTVQIIRDTLGGGYPKCHQISHGEGGEGVGKDDNFVCNFTDKGDLRLVSRHPGGEGG